MTNEERPQMAQSSVFFERYSRAEQANLSLKYTVWLLGGVCAALCAALVFVVGQPRAIFYIPSTTYTGLAFPDKVPVSSVKSFATSWLSNWMNYTPETVKGVYERSFPYMTPQILSRLRARTDEELKKIARDRLSSSLVLKSEPAVEEMARGFVVMFKGDQAVYMGKELMASDAVEVVLNVVRVTPTDKNPYGLAVADIKKEKITGEVL